jgi:hypothetical protein
MPEDTLLSNCFFLRGQGKEKGDHPDKFPVDVDILILKPLRGRNSVKIPDGQQRHMWKVSRT